MKGEKGVIIGILALFTIIVLFSFTPGFTGYGVVENDENIKVELNDVNPGTTAKETLKLELNNEEPIYVKLAVEGESKEWVGLSDETYLFFPGENEAQIYVHVPEGTEDGEYNAKIIVMSMGDSDKESPLKDQIIYYVPIKITVSSKVLEGIEITSLEAYNTEYKEDIYLKSIVSNTGNQEVNKILDIEIFDSTGKLVKQESVDINLLPYEEKEVIYHLDNNFGLGAYNLRVSVDEQEKTSSLKIKESIESKGEIVYSIVNVNNDKEVNVIVYFKNTGEKVITSAIEGITKQEGIVINDFKTDSQVILPNNYEKFEYSYYENVEGEYNLGIDSISGSIVMDSKIKEFYNKGFLSLDSNVYIVLAIVLFLLMALHYVFKRKKEK